MKNASQMVAPILSLFHLSRPDTAPYFDTALASQEMILRFVKEIGAERVLFASDIPFGQMKAELAKVLSLPIKDDAKELILSKNVKRLIGLD